MSQANLETLFARRATLWSEINAIAEALPKSKHGFRAEECALPPELLERKAELAEVKRAIKRARVAEPPPPVPVGRTPEEIEAEMAPLRDERRAMRARLIELEAERNLALAIAEVEAMPQAKRQALVIAAQSIPSAEAVGVPNTKPRRK